MKQPLFRMLAILLLAGSLPAQEIDYAQPPHWPHGLRLPDDMVVRKAVKPGSPPRADVLVWIPHSAEGIRAVLLIPENTDSKHFGEHAALRSVAARHGVAIVYFRGFDTGLEKQDGPTDPARIQQLLDHLANVLDPAFRNAPWIPFGKSSRGKFPFRLAWVHSERTIASITYHGETPHWPPPENLMRGGSTLLHVNVNGETEWERTWLQHVRPALLNYRAQTPWLCHQIVVRGVGHGDYPDAHGSPGWGKSFPGQVTCIRVWDYLSLFMDKALTLRLPSGPIPDDHSLELRPIDPELGWLIDPHAVEIAFGIPDLPLTANGWTSATKPADTPPASVPVVRPPPIQPATGVPEALRSGFFWVPDQETAEAWMALHLPVP